MALSMKTQTAAGNGSSAVKAAVKAAPASAEETTEDGKPLGWMSKNLFLKSFLYEGGQEKNTRTTFKGEKVNITKPKTIVGARVQFQTAYDKVPVIPFDRNRATREKPFYVPTYKDITRIKVPAKTVRVMNILELAVMLIGPDFNGRFYTEKSFDSYVKAIQPGQTRNPDDKTVKVHALVQGQYTKDHKSPDEVRFTLTLGSSTPDAYTYRLIQNCENVINQTNDGVASEEFQGFSLFIPKRRRSVGKSAGAKKANDYHVTSSAGGKSFLQLMGAAPSAL